jgi:hypothetical protein
MFKATGPLTEDTIVRSLYGGHAGQSLQTEQVLRFTSGSFVPRSARGEQSARKRFKLTVLCLNPPVHVGRALVARPGAQQRSQYLAVRRAAARLRGAFTDVNAPPDGQFVLERAGPKAHSKVDERQVCAPTERVIVLQPARSSRVEYVPRPEPAVASDREPSTRRCSRRTPAMDDEE